MNISIIRFTLISALLMSANGVIAQSDEDMILEEVIVSAQKREQNVSKVGITIDVFTNEDLKKLRLINVNDLAQVSPNLSIHGPFGDMGFPEITLRGQNADFIGSTSPQSTGVYIDGVYLTNPPLLTFQMFDLERVEVLKGPQGTLFGRNTTGGAVTFYSRRPGDEPDGYVRLGYGRWNRIEVDAAIGGPMSENVSGRLAVHSINQSGGPLYNSATGTEDGEVKRWAVRAQLLWTPTDNVSLLLKAHGGSDDSDAWPFSQIGIASSFMGFPVPAACDDFLTENLAGVRANCTDFNGYQDLDGDPYTNALSNPPFHDVDTSGFMAELNWDFEKMSLTSVTAYDTMDRHEAFDSDGSPNSLLDNFRTHELEQTSQELRLTSDTDTAFSWIIGAYYGADNIKATPAPRRFGFDLNFGAPIAQTKFDLDTKTLAVFAHTEWQFADSWNLTLAGRITNTEREYDFNQSAFEADGSLRFEFVNAKGLKLDDTDWSGKIGLDYSLNDDTLIYGNISRGINAGTFQGEPTFAEAALGPTESETVTAYEIGVKSYFLDRTLRLNAAAFFYDYKNMQIAAVQQVGPDNFTGQILTNADGATISGFEVESMWLAAEGLQLNLAAAYLNTELDDLLLQDYTGAVHNYKGESLANSPEWSLNGFARYERPVSDSLKTLFQLDFSWEDKIKRDIQGTPLIFSDAHWLLNGRIAVGDLDSKWDVAFWVKNLLDETYVTEAFQLAGFLGSIQYTYNLPRSYGVSFQYNFF